MVGDSSISRRAVPHERMVKVELPYGAKGHQDIELDRERFLGVIRPLEVEVHDEAQVIDASLDDPCGGKDITSFLEGGKDIVFIVNDGTRPTPTAKVLDALADRFDLTKARYLVATGTHRAPTEEELRFIFGRPSGQAAGPTSIPTIPRRTDCVSLGISKNGTEMEVNEMAVQADRLVIITSVEPHYFAGYTGGRKSFLPGVASYRRPSSRTTAGHEAGGQGAGAGGQPGPRGHDGRPEGRQRTSRSSRSRWCWTGIRRSTRWRPATCIPPSSRRSSGPTRSSRSTIKEKADVVITIAPYPMDVDLYQSQKALDNAKMGVEGRRDDHHGVQVSGGHRGRDVLPPAVPSRRPQAHPGEPEARSTSSVTTRRPRWPRSWTGRALRGDRP